MTTIYALATARGRSGVAVVRISGPLAFAAAERLAGDRPAPRRAALRVLRDSQGEVVDQALVITFERGASFTGEDVAELQLHGGPAVIDAVVKELGRIEGLRLAQPGEFTRRALDNGCLDLAQVEGLADLIEAETEAQRRQAQRLFAGALGAKAEGWRTRLIRAVALLEATIDFADEEVPEDVSVEVEEILTEVVPQLQQEAAGSRIAERIRDGFEVAIIGAPNTGKSTLLNCLAGREAAITSEIAGTTRDVIEVRMDLKGIPVTILDTAGLRETEDEVESIGIDRALSRAANADLRIFLLDEAPKPLQVAPEPQDITVFGKADLGKARGFAVSGVTGEGLDELTNRIATVLEERVAGAATSTRARHRQGIEAAVDALQSAMSQLSEARHVPEIAAEDIRFAIRSLESLVGRVDVEQVLDEIFAKFCLGK